MIDILEGYSMIRVTAAIIEQAGKFLIARRKAGPLAHLWEFPGGKIEEGESPEQCLKREIFEEFGVEISVERYLTTSQYTYPHISIELMGFLALYQQGEFKLTDHDAILWVTPEEMREYDFAPADIPLCEYLIQLKYGESVSK